MKLRIATIEFLRGDVGNALLKDFGFPVFSQHYSHHTATEPTFARFTQQITRQVYFLSDGNQLRRSTIWPNSKRILEANFDKTLENSERLAQAFVERANNYDDEVLWAHWFTHTHKGNPLEEYHARASEVVSVVKRLIAQLPGDWIVSADHAICWESPHRRIDKQTLHVPLASNWLLPFEGRTHHDCLAAAINAGEPTPLYAWNTLECYDDWPGGRIGGLGNEYQMLPDGTLTPIDQVPEADEAHVTQQLEKLGYLE